MAIFRQLSNPASCSLEGKPCSIGMFDLGPGRVEPSAPFSGFDMECVTNFIQAVVYREKSVSVLISVINIRPLIDNGAEFAGFQSQSGMLLPVLDVCDGRLHA